MFYFIAILRTDILYIVLMIRDSKYSWGKKGYIQKMYAKLLETRSLMDLPQEGQTHLHHIG